MSYNYELETIHFNLLFVVAKQKTFTLISYKCPRSSYYIQYKCFNDALG